MSRRWPTAARRLPQANEDGADIDAEFDAEFRPVPGGATAFFEQAQAGVIRGLVSQIAELVSADSEGALGDAEAGSPGSSGGAAGLGLSGVDAHGLGLGGPADAASGGTGDTADELEAELGLSSHARPPDDPVLARLLPDGYDDDPEASAEFRRYTEETLRSGKVASARTVLASLPPGGGEVQLSEAECREWLRALNDVRLALSVRLGITDENEDPTEHMSVDDPRAAYIWIYQWLAYLQDSLIEALS
ncbi:MAG TPA: DUF2017 domain-containing protein [Streptosporangiaceae bacterium]